MPVTPSELTPIHPMNGLPPIGLVKRPDSRIHVHQPTRNYQQWTPNRPYLLDAPGLGVCRLDRVTVSDYRTQGDPDRIKIGYTLHPQTKQLQDHNGRKAGYSEMWVAGARRMGREPLEDRLADAARALVAAWDEEDAAAARAEQARSDERAELTERAERLGVDLRWDADGEPILTRDLLALVLAVAERHTAEDDAVAVPFDPGTGPVPGYVAGACGHRVAESEWAAGFRTCERCPG